MSSCLKFFITRDIIRRESVKRKYSILVFVAVIIFFSPGMRLSAQENKEIRFIPIGDSYTIGAGASAQESWPALLTSHLKSEGFDIHLANNPAHAGWTTVHAIKLELPALKEGSPNFVTLMIGVNDWTQGMEGAEFRRNFAYLLDAIQVELKGKGQLLVVNIPDFSMTPSGKAFGRERDISHGIGEFNQIIVDESHKRGLSVVDVYSASQKMRDNPAMIAADGLHPSAKGYLLFEEAIYPAARKLLENFHRGSS